MNTASQEQACYRRTEELGGLELLDASYHRQNFSRHTHEGYTLGVIETGAQRFFRTGATECLGGGHGGPDSLGAAPLSRAGSVRQRRANL